MKKCENLTKRERTKIFQDLGYRKIPHFLSHYKVAYQLIFLGDNHRDMVVTSQKVPAIILFFLKSDVHFCWYIFKCGISKLWRGCAGGHQYVSVDCYSQRRPSLSYPPPYSPLPLIRISSPINSHTQCTLHMHTSSSRPHCCHNCFSIKLLVNWEFPLLSLCIHSCLLRT